MPAVSSEILSRYKNFWHGRNAEPLLNVAYAKNAAGAPPLKPWMGGNADWIFARGALRAYETGEMSAVADALDVMEHDLGNQGFLCEGYANANLNTGAGCVAAFVTGFANYYSQTVWFELDAPWDYDKIIALPADRTTRFMETQLKAVEMAAERFKGGAVLTTLDLGGLADVLSSLRRTDGFLYDLADRPGDVTAGLNALRGVWKRAHGRMVAITEPANGGLYSSWTRILSDTLYYPSQCDACAMVSPAMFDAYIWPTLSEEISAYEKTIYHLDGSGEIPHLATMCTNPALRVIQWVPEPALSQGDESYYPLYEQIISLGRKIIFNGFKGDLKKLPAFLKRFPREAFFISLDFSNYDDAMRAAESVLG